MTPQPKKALDFNFFRKMTFALLRYVAPVRRPQRRDKKSHIQDTFFIVFIMKFTKGQCQHISQINSPSPSHLTSSEQVTGSDYTNFAK
jgi:hypothetical protein